MEFTIYDDDDVGPFLEGLEERPQRKVRVDLELLWKVVGLMLAWIHTETEQLTWYPG